MYPIVTMSSLPVEIQIFKMAAQSAVGVELAKQELGRLEQSPG